LALVTPDSRHVAEPKVVVANREDLWWLLAEASQLEHMIMCQYLFAEFSLKENEAEGLSREQSEAVERWRKVLRGIAVEEMLHLALVANVTASIGAAPTFARPNFPQRSNYFPASIQLDLLPFGERALRHFLYLERPEGMERQDAEGFIPSAPPRDPLTEQELMPRGQEFLTIGHLYRGIEDGLRMLTDKLGERPLFVGSARAQATPELLGGWKQLIPVTGLESALAAIKEIIEQGEGARGDWRDAHYGRFLNIWDEYHALREADSSFEPARPVLAAYTRQPFDIATDVPVISDSRTLRVAELATVAYELVVHMLTRFFTHTDETDVQLEVLIGTAIELMGAVIRPLGVALTKLPVGPPYDGRTAGLGFEMYYRMGNFVPWRGPAWALLHERAAFLVETCTVAADQDREPAIVADAGQRMESIAGKLSAHVPDELLSAQAR
jgi:Ferritin-like